MPIVFFWLMLSIVVGIIAGSRNRSVFGWSLISLLLSPVIGLICVVCLPPLIPAASGPDPLAAMKRIGIEPEPALDYGTESSMPMTRRGKLITVSMLALLALIVMTLGIGAWRDMHKGEQPAKPIASAVSRNLLIVPDPSLTFAADLALQQSDAQRRLVPLN